MLSIALFSLAACAPDSQSPIKDSRYNSDTMAKDWREQVRKNKTNPYEGYSDNDTDYNAPKAKINKTKPQKVYQYQSPQGGGYVILPPVDNNEDSNYGKFPRYNPDDDNVYTDPKDYPLYME